MSELSASLAIEADKHSLERAFHLWMASYHKTSNDAGASSVIREPSSMVRG